MRVRPIRPDDVPAVVGLVCELAAYEEAEHEVRLTADQLTAALFGDSPRCSATSRNGTARSWARRCGS